MKPLPLAIVHDAVLEFLRGRADAVVFGATAVNAYVAESRMTQDIDLLLLAFPELKQVSGPVAAAMETLGATDQEVASWHELVAQEIPAPDEDAKFR